METVEALLDIPPLLRRPPTPGPWRPLERAAAPRPRPPWHVVHPAIVRAYLDGWRLCVVVTAGPKWLHLVEAGALAHHKLPASAAEGFRVAQDTSPARVAGLLRRVRAAHDAAGAAYPAGWVKKALGAIR